MIDYQITKDKYLSEVERQDKEDIQTQIIASEIPSEVFDCFRVVGPKDKLTAIRLIFQVCHGGLLKILNVFQ